MKLLSAGGGGAFFKQSGLFPLGFQRTCPFQSGSIAMMTGRLGCLGWLLVLAMGLIGFAWLASPNSRTVRYRLTLEVDTPEGVKSGSSVSEVTEYYGEGWIREFDSSSAGLVFKGQAAMVDLGPRGLLFCVLQYDLERSPNSVGRPPDFPRGYFADLTPKDHWSPALFDQLNSISPRPKRSIPIGKLPLLVRFRDPNNSQTVERVDPYHLNLKFGGGVRIKEATIEVTDDYVTSGIEQRLPWLHKQRGYLESPLGSSTNSSQAGTLLQDDLWSR